MARAVCSKTKLEKLYIEETKRFGRPYIDAMEQFSKLFSEANEDLTNILEEYFDETNSFEISSALIKILEANSDRIFGDMLNGSIAEQTGFTQLKDLSDRIGTDECKQAFSEAISNEKIFTGVSNWVDALATYITILNEVEKTSDFDIHAMDRYTELSDEYNTAIEPSMVREGLTGKVEWISNNVHSNFSDRLIDAVISNFEDMPWDVREEGIVSFVGSFPKGAELKDEFTYEDFGLIWNTTDKSIVEDLGDLGEVKVAVNLKMLSYSVIDTFNSENASGQGRYDNRLALVYVYLKSCYASRQLMLDYMNRLYRNDDEVVYGRDFSDYISDSDNLERLLARLTTTTDMGADQNLFDSLDSFDKAFSDALADIEQNEPAQTASSVPIISCSPVATDWDTTFAIKADGSLWGWGWNNHGQLCDGTDEDRYSPIHIMDDVSFVQGDYYTIYAIKNDGSLWGWGSNGDNRLGNVFSEDSYSPVHIMDDVSFVQTFMNRTYAIKNDGTLWGWGSNWCGILGDDTDEDRYFPVHIMDDVSFIHLGHFSTYAVKNDGTLWAWGDNWDGQLGDGTTEDRRLPVYITDDVYSVQSDGISTYALKNDGTLWAWGTNFYGELGDGTTEDRHSPVHIMDDVSSFRYGDSSTYAIKDDGTLWAWGYNDYGQLGDGTTEDRYSPVHIMDDVSFVQAGQYNAYALKNDGTLWTWGLNKRGQLGDGTDEDRHSPIHIMDDVSYVHAYWSSVYAVKNDGTLWGWGANGGGQIGDGTDEDRRSPALILEGIRMQ